MYSTISTGRCVLSNIDYKMMWSKSVHSSQSDLLSTHSYTFIEIACGGKSERERSVLNLGH